MAGICYFVTGPSFGGEYGIAAVDHAGKHSAVTMHFLKERRTAECLANRLNEAQMPISDFCEAFSNGSLAETL